MNNRALGAIGEDIACEYLIKNGYKIIDRNVHFSKLCEIDIIAKYKDKIIFIEVKTRRSNNYGNPLEAINKTKYNNIKIGILSYLQEHKIKNFQIDAVGIVLEPQMEIQHLKNISW